MKTIQEAGLLLELVWAHIEAHVGEDRGRLVYGKIGAVLNAWVAMKQELVALDAETKETSKAGD